MRAHDRSNDQSRTRLIGAVERWRQDGAPVGAAAALAHLAWWDRYYASRWRLRMAGQLDAHTGFGLSVTNSLNDAGADMWAKLSFEQSAALATEAAAAVDAVVAALSDELVAETETRGAHRLLERALHRAEHLEELAQ